MSTIASLPSAPLGSRPASAPAHKGTAGVRRASGSARGLSILLLAAVVAAMVVVADRMISTWADEQLFLAWVFLWVVVFAGIAVFADTARSLARRLAVSLDSWSQTLAEARAEARLWEAARSDRRLMSELIAARTRDTADEPVLETPANPAAFADALAPLGLPATPKADAVPDSLWVRTGMARARKQLAYSY